MITVISVLLLAPLLLRVKIDCGSQYGECPQEVKTDIAEIKAGSLFSTRRALTKYLGRSFLVSEYSLQFKLPDILRADLVIKKPVFALEDPLNQKFNLIDNGGKVLAVTDFSTLPVVTDNDGLKNVGEDLDSNKLFALKIVQGVFQMFQVARGKIEGEALVIDLTPELKVIFPLQGDSDLLLGSLRLIVSKIQNESPGKYTQIDLRYKNPVLR